MCKYFGLMFLLWGFVLVGTGAPGINLWQLIDKLCSVVEANDSEIDASLGAVYTLATDIDAHLDNVTGSSLNVVVSSLEQLTNSLMMANSITDSLVSNIDIFSTQLESLVDAITILENLDTLVVTGSCSCLDLAVHSATAAVVSDLDLLRTDLDSCCSSLSLFDVIIKSDIDSVSTKVDGLSSQVSVVQSELDASCSVVGSLYTCLVGTAITQSMIPYTITAPGDYFLCECVTTASANSVITIAANNVYLNLNGNTITTTGAAGIVSDNQNSIYIENGSIVPLTEAIAIVNCSDVCINNIVAINAGQNPIYFGSVTNFSIENCIIDGTTDLSFSSGFYLYECGLGRLVNCFSYKQATFSFFNMFSESIDFVDCVSIGAVFYIVGSESDGAIVRNCIVTDSPSGGFTQQSVDGIVYENCLARMCLQSGFITADHSADIVYKNCVSNDNTQTGFWAIELSMHPVFEGCVANNNPQYGFFMDGGITEPVLERCTATNNGINGFLLAGLSNGVLNRCIAAGNAGAGIDNSGANTFIVDSRSQYAATTVNPAYNLNGAVDVIGGATQIIIS